MLPETSTTTQHVSSLLLHLPYPSPRPFFHSFSFCPSLSSLLFPFPLPLTPTPLLQNYTRPLPPFLHTVRVILKLAGGGGLGVASSQKIRKGAWCICKNSRMCCVFVWRRGITFIHYQLLNSWHAKVVDSFQDHFKMGTRLILFINLQFLKFKA